ncbi:hypothetical protein D7Y23_12690 [Corallococcus sp. AB050B]|nr:hypothetical protein D7Y23_12690 [Corallococcus sp. AB050B]
MRPAGRRGTGRGSRPGAGTRCAARGARGPGGSARTEAFLRFRPPLPMRQGPSGGLSGGRRTDQHQR